MCSKACLWRVKRLVPHEEAVLIRMLSCKALIWHEGANLSLLLVAPLPQQVKIVFVLTVKAV